MYTVTLIPIASFRVSSRAYSRMIEMDISNEATLSMRHASVRLFNSFVASFSESNVICHISLSAHHLRGICSIVFFFKLIYEPIVHTYIDTYTSSRVLFDHGKVFFCQSIESETPAFALMITSLSFYQSSWHIGTLAINADETSLCK